VVTGENGGDVCAIAPLAAAAVTRIIVKNFFIVFFPFGGYPQLPLRYWACEQDSNSLPHG
jgi:hypothetical protein